MADVGGFLRKLFPVISAAATFGGPIGVMASGIVGKILHVDNIDPTPDAIETAVKGATPEQAIALKQAEQQFELQLNQLGLTYDVQSETLAAADRASARARELGLQQSGRADYTPEVGFYLLIVIFGLVLHWLLKWPIPTENRAIIYSAIGSLGTLVVSASSYFYGTTRNAGNKDATIAQTAQTLLAKTPAK